MPENSKRYKYLYGVLSILGLLAAVGSWLLTKVADYTSAVNEPNAEAVNPCASPHSLQEQVRCAENDLHPGTLAFEPKREMDQGETETVSIRISPDKSAEVGKGFKHGPPVLQEIRVGPLMKATLDTDTAPEDFTIRRIGEEKKIITAPYTEWTWEVTPLTAGDKTLLVSVYAELMLPNGDKEPYEAFTGSAVIHVHTKATYVIGKFVKENWQWLLGSPLLLGLVGWLWTRGGKKKKRDAGFNFQP